ncbi:GOLD domain [Dillenia turbinata]|uniref:GOLD domain n=1 Tax=Dillenia turbinata TaxID=194707 RepID=A0AAN8UZV2_9MAGN
MNRNLSVSLILFLWLVLISHCESLRFDLRSGHTKCISEDIKGNSMTVGKYSVVNPNEGSPMPDTHKITVRVTSAYGNSYHYADRVDSGHFAFTTAEAGDYMACFWAVDHNPQTTLTIDFDWKSGVAAKDWSNVAKKGQIDVMELEVKKLYDTVTSIHEEMFYLRGRQVVFDHAIFGKLTRLNTCSREEEMQELNESTNSKMAWLSFLSLLVCLSVAGLQFWHLKTFFERKKLL